MLDGLDHGKLRVVARVPGETGQAGWRTNQWIKKAILLSFRLKRFRTDPGGPAGATWWTKVEMKFADGTPPTFGAAGFRAVPGAIVRRSAYVAPGVVVMPVLHQSRRLCR